MNKQKVLQIMDRAIAITESIPKPSYEIISHAIGITTLCEDILYNNYRHELLQVLYREGFNIDLVAYSPDGARNFIVTKNSLLGEVRVDISEDRETVRVRNMRTGKSIEAFLPNESLVATIGYIQTYLEEGN